jgi:hypothetical protein
MRCDRRRRYGDCEACWRERRPTRGSTLVEAPSSTGSSERTSVSQYGQTFQCCSSGALQRRHAFFSFDVQTGQIRKLDSISDRQ